MISISSKTAVYDKDQPLLYQIPKNNFLYLFTFLGTEELGRMTRACTRLRTVLLENQVCWQYVAQNILGIPKAPTPFSWRDCVIIREQQRKDIYQKKHKKLLGFLTDCRSSVKPESFPRHIREQGYKTMMIHKGDFIVYTRSTKQASGLFNMKIALTNAKNVVIRELQINDLQEDGIPMHSFIFDYCSQTDRWLLGLAEDQGTRTTMLYTRQIPKDVPCVSINSFKKIPFSHLIEDHFRLFNTKIPLLDNDSNCLVVHDWSQDHFRQVFPMPKLYGCPASSKLTMVGEILIELTHTDNTSTRKHDLLIGYQLQSIENSSEREWKEIWRTSYVGEKQSKKELRYCYITLFPSKDETTLVIEEHNNPYKHTHIVYNPFTGKEVTRFESSISSEVSFSSICYALDDSSWVTFRDYSPINITKFQNAKKQSIKKKQKIKSPPIHIKKLSLDAASKNASAEKPSKKMDIQKTENNLKSKITWLIRKIASYCSIIFSAIKNYVFSILCLRKVLT